MLIQITSKGEDGQSTSAAKLAFSLAIKGFNLLNCAPAVERIIKAKDKDKLDHYRLSKRSA